jgi:hypothetical protein
VGIGKFWLLRLALLLFIQFDADKMEDVILQVPGLFTMAKSTNGIKGEINGSSHPEENHSLRKSAVE